MSQFDVNFGKVAVLLVLIAGMLGQGGHGCRAGSLSGAVEAGSGDGRAGPEPGTGASWHCNCPSSMRWRSGCRVRLPRHWRAIPAMLWVEPDAKRYASAKACPTAFPWCRRRN